MTFAEEIEMEANSEPIESVVVSSSRGWTYHEDEQIVKSWDEVRPTLDYEYYRGYGGVDCHAIWAWTPSKVIFVSQYDGSTLVQSVPRNPTAGIPDMPGG